MTKTVYLTIDDAPSADFMAKLDILTARGIRAVWFCQGNFLEQRGDMALEALRRGHRIGNHTYSHPFLSALPLDQVFAELRATHAIIAELYEQAGIEWVHRAFRFPYNDTGTGRFGDIQNADDTEAQRRTEAIQQYLRKLGYTAHELPDITYPYFQAYRESGNVGWAVTFSSHDWALNVPNPPDGIDSPEKVLARIDRHAPEEGLGMNDPQSAELILVHDYADNTPLFERTIDKILSKGIVFGFPLPE